MLHAATNGEKTVGRVLGVIEASAARTGIVNKRRLKICTMTTINESELSDTGDDDILPTSEGESVYAEDCVLLVTVNTLSIGCFSHKNLFCGSENDKSYLIFHLSKFSPHLFEVV